MPLANEIFMSSNELKINNRNEITEFQKMNNVFFLLNTAYHIRLLYFSRWQWKHGYRTT